MVSRRWPLAHFEIMVTRTDWLVEPVVLDLSQGAAPSFDHARDQP
jgi:hypothetical protein